LVAACASSSPTPAPATAATPAGAPGTTPTAAPAGAKEALVVIKEIDAEPFREDDAFRAKRTALMDWLTKSPDITVVLCQDSLPHLDADAHPRDSVLFVQMMFGQAAYQLEHPGISSTDEAVFVSGVASSVRAYRKLLALHPEERRAEWDQLDTAERQQSLAPRVKACLKR
jgi:hypothetical protein